MTNLFRRARSNKTDPTPGRFTLAGKSVSCPHCGGTEFTASEAQLNTALATLIELDWLNKTAAILACTSCGQIQWFGVQPARI